MARILIWRAVEKGNELDIFNETDYGTFFNDVSNRFSGGCPNWGNKLWFQGLYSAIDDGNNIISFKTNEPVEEINEKYDMIIYPMANIFGVEYLSSFRLIEEGLKGVRIPVYVIACGAQTDTYNDLDTLVKDIGEESKRFINAVYSTGGEFALRGHFSKEFFDRLGFTSAVVTGCPSMYQLGRDFQVNNIKVSREEFVPIFNGKIEAFYNAACAYSQSVYIDQDYLFPCLFDPNYLKNYQSYRFMRNFQYYIGVPAAHLLAQNRVRMIVDMNDWHCYLKNGPFNYSFGTRIHGSIMSLLSGVPATVLAQDTRTREMAEFFDIPCKVIDKNARFNANDVYESYLCADYTKFNQAYQGKYDRYEAFLKEKGIVNSINQRNTFFNADESDTTFEDAIVNSKEFELFYTKLKKKKFVLDLGCALMNVKNKVKQK